MSGDGVLEKRRPKQLKKVIIDSLTEQERLSFVTLLSIFFKPSKLVDSSSMYLESCEVKTFFGFLHKLLFGEWVFNTQSSAVKIFENLDEIKKALEGVPTTITFSRKTDSNPAVYPQIPKKLQVNNETIRAVWVTVHAWERFCERFRLKQLGSAEIADLLTASFCRAKPVELKKGYRIIRFINNKLEDTQYFFDTVKGCRFVVVRQNEKFVLKTVEIPRHP